MQTRFWGKKILVSDLTNPERMQLRKTAVNVKTQGSNLLLEDNIFNRLLLSLDISDIFRDISAVNTSMHESARDYQKRDIAQILSSKFALNRNKPGYGKTFESIEWCRLKDLKRILIICPKSVVLQWKDQFTKWWPEVEPFIQVWGDGPEKAERVIYITNYEQLTPYNVAPKGSKQKVLVYPQVWAKCKQWSWDVIICDESHRIKNANAQITVAVKMLPSQRRLALTGTPILSRPDDLWSQLHFLDERLSGSSYWAFVERFCEIDADNFGRKPVGLTPSDSAKELLAKALAAISVGGDNHQVTAGKNHIPIELRMEPEQRKLYQEIVNLSLDELQEKGITIKNAMDQIVKQQQVTTNCCKFIYDGTRKMVCPKNPKFEWIRDWLEDNEGEKVVIFSKYAEAAKALDMYLSSKKIGCCLYIGEMSGKVRTAAKDAFVQLPAKRVLIGTIGALGTGVDGLQHVCRNVIFLDRDYTPGLNEQAEDRVNRSGQTGMTNIWILHMKHTIDEHVEGIQSKKASDIEEVFEYVRNCARSGE